MPNSERKPKTTIELDESKLPPGMLAGARRERVAELIWDWVREGQVTHRRTWAQAPEDQKTQYREVAKSIAAIYED